MEAAAVSTEIWVLGWSVVLLIGQVIAQACAAYDLGPKYLFSPRDEGRVSPSVHNLLETYPAFVALVLALAVTGTTGGIAATGAVPWLIARAPSMSSSMVRALRWYGR
jgi:uncharacterized MAPEG superfamily protein